MKKLALHHKVYLTKKDDYDKDNQNSIFPFYTTHLFEQHCYHVYL
ncbi:Cytoplasmic alpha-amylase [Geobacillus stearothermophilus]|nr:Cytoplasmic alpha-amylase [Geobacillus stearothermophilus]